MDFHNDLSGKRKTDGQEETIIITIEFRPTARQIIYVDVHKIGIVRPFSENIPKNLLERSGETPINIRTMLLSILGNFWINWSCISI